MKNFDFFIQTIEDMSIHFAYDGTFQIHVDNNQPLHYKDFEMAFQGYKAMKNFIDMTPEK